VSRTLAHSHHGTHVHCTQTPPPAVHIKVEPGVPKPKAQKGSKGGPAAVTTKAATKKPEAAAVTKKPNTGGLGFQWNQIVPPPESRFESRTIWPHFRTALSEPEKSLQNNLASVQNRLFGATRSKHGRERQARATSQSEKQEATVRAMRMRQ
jgi:hypothetical protein